MNNVISEAYNALPPAARKPIYLGYALLGLVLGATQSAYGAIDSAQPTWLTVAMTVYTFVGVALGLTAYSNTPKVTQTGTEGNTAGEQGALFTPAELEAQVDPNDAPSEEYRAKHTELQGGDYTSNIESDVPQDEYEVIESGEPAEQSGPQVAEVSDTGYESPAEIAKRM